MSILYTYDDDTERLQRQYTYWHKKYIAGEISEKTYNELIEIINAEIDENNAYKLEHGIYNLKFND